MKDINEFILRVNRFVLKLFVVHVKVNFYNVNILNFTAQPAATISSFLSRMRSFHVTNSNNLLFGNKIVTKLWPLSSRSMRTEYNTLELHRKNIIIYIATRVKDRPTVVAETSRL